MRFLQNWNHLALQRSYAWSLVLYSLFWGAGDCFRFPRYVDFSLARKSKQPYLFAVFEFGAALWINNKTNDDKHIRN